MSVLSMRGLGKRYGTVTALVGFDLDIAEGARVAVVGPSGSGKTTLLRLVAGFEAPSGGAIHLDGVLVADAESGVPPYRRNVGLVMQEGALFPHLNVLDNIRFGIREVADSRERALALMGLVELDPTMSDRQPHQLSGGQQQRVALARALARRPRVMLLDEPFSALDAGLREQMRNATARILADAGITTILVTHDREEAMSFADHLVVLREGRLVQAGTPQDLYRVPADPVTAAFLGPALLLSADVSDGLAHCLIGALSLPAARDGPTQILLRPEQLRFVPAATGALVWRVTAVSQAGAVARVTLARSDDKVLTFDAVGQDIPEIGTLTGLAVAGPVHRF